MSPEEDQPGWDCRLHGNRICGEVATQCVTPDGWPYTTSYATCPEPAVTVPVPQSLPTLPQTGLEGSLAGIGLTLVVLGAVVRRIGRR